MPDHNERCGISLQPRDIEILRSLLESRVMTIRHASILHFQGRIEAAKKRILRLRKAGFISVRPRRAFEPIVLSISKTGLQILDRSCLLPEIPEFSLETFVRRSAVSERTLRHELEVMDVKAAFLHASLDCKSLSIQAFGTWPSRYRFHVEVRGRTKGLWIKPDGYIRTSSASHSGYPRFDHFYLEVDRSTESLSTLVEKCSGYMTQGHSLKSSKCFPFRVLVVLKTREREANLLAKIAEVVPAIRTLVWTSTFDEATRNPFGLIWSCPSDHSDSPKRSILPDNDSRRTHRPIAAQN